mmetsp:Transcript_4886/g.10105  ORF Transcript_4886/g.10105 Transcript_4886/m.10105 type:complete len:231 (-) Transcript_4886:489-1181(-)
MLLGNSPLKSLFPRLKTSRSVIDSRLSGIHPERSLLFKVNSVRASKFPISQGRFPLRLLLSKWTWVSEFIYTMLYGIPPLNLLFPRSRIWRLTNSPKSMLKLSSSLFCRRRRLTRLERSPSTDGMLPVNSLPSRTMCCKEFESRDSSDGRVPPSAAPRMLIEVYIPFASQGDSVRLEVYQVHSSVYFSHPPIPASFRARESSWVLPSRMEGSREYARTASDHRCTRRSSV